MTQNKNKKTHQPKKKNVCCFCCVLTLLTAAIIFRAGRCIIFTTHYLEEADILANRKAVLAHGRVQAVGTSRDLKQRPPKGENEFVVSVQKRKRNDS